MEKLEKLGEMDIFRGFSNEELMEVSRVAMEKIFPAGQSIIEEGKSSRGLYLIVSGEVSVTKQIPTKGGTVSETIARLGPGDHFGEMSLIDGKPASASIVASAPSICFEIKTDGYDKLNRENPIIALKLYQFFTKALCERLRRTDTFLMEELFRKRRGELDTSLLKGSI